jgi:hypothetical protein
VLELFSLVNTLHRNANYDNKSTMINSVKGRLTLLDKECFIEPDVQSAYRSIKDSVDKKVIGELICIILNDDKSVTDDIIKTYQNETISYSYVEDDDFVLSKDILGVATVTLIIIAVLTELFLIITAGGNARIAEVMGKSFALIFPYAMSALIIVTTVFSVIRLLRDGGNE